MHEGYIIYIADTETTGLIATKHEIVELSLIRLYFGTDKPTEQKTWLIRALNPSSIEDEALNKSGHKKEDVLGLSKFGRENYLLPSQVLPEVENWVAEDDVMAADRVMAGHNVLFDIGMMEELWKRNNSYETFPFETGPNKKIMDTKQIAVLIDILLNYRRKYYNLSSIVKAYGVKKEKAHRADADTRMTLEVLLKQLAPLQEAIVKAFGDSKIEE